MYRFHYNARWAWQLSNFGDKGRGGNKSSTTSQGPQINSLHLRTLIQMDLARSYPFSRAITHKQVRIDRFLLPTQIEHVLVFPKEHYEPQNPQSYLFLLSSAVSGYPRTSFLFLGELFYILRESRILTHFTTLLDRRYFWNGRYLHPRKQKL